MFDVKLVEVGFLLVFLETFITSLKKYRNYTGSIPWQTKKMKIGLQMTEF